MQGHIQDLTHPVPSHVQTGQTSLGKLPASGNTAETVAGKDRRQCLEVTRSQKPL